jgi:hypothetical protein
MERAFFQRNIFMSPECMVTKKWLLIEIKTIKQSSSVLKKCMSLKKDDGRRAVFGSFFIVPCLAC